MSTDPATGLPANVCPHQVVDFDFFAPPGVERDFHAAWSTLHAADVPDVVWTPHNGGHWIATRGDLVEEVFSDYATFSNRVVIIPKARGELYRMLPTTLDPPEHRPVRSAWRNGSRRRNRRPVDT